MGLSLTSAIFGLGLALLGATLLLVRTRRRLGIALLIVGVVLIVVPYGTLYFLID